MNKADAKKKSIRRVLLSVSDKTGVVVLAKAFADAGAELVATGKTAEVIKASGLNVRSIETLSGSPEAFQGRMKTLSFPICSGILYRRGDSKDEADLANLKIEAIDAVVVNFYPFEKTGAIEEIDIGGPTLVRAAAKNAPDVLAITDPAQYGEIIAELQAAGSVSEALATRCAARAWARVAEYDAAINQVYGEAASGKLALRYGENPHQTGFLEIEADSPIAWPKSETENLTASALSYNNIMDLSAAYGVALDWHTRQTVVIVKHNNPCGFAVAATQREALELAWAGDPTSAFGGVLVFSRPLEEESVEWLGDKFIEALAAPGLSKAQPAFQKLSAKRKNLKAVAIRNWTAASRSSSTTVTGGRLVQTVDQGFLEKWDWKTKKVPSVSELAAFTELARFGISATRALKSNAVAFVRRTGSTLQLVGAGQGQPNRIEALERLAIPRARRLLGEQSADFARLDSELCLISDAFFPFRDTVDAAAKAGVRWIVQPGGSKRDGESIAACDEQGIGMVFTGVRHFRH